MKIQCKARQATARVQAATRHRTFPRDADSELVYVGVVHQRCFFFKVFCNAHPLTFVSCCFLPIIFSVEASCNFSEELVHDIVPPVFGPSTWLDIVEQPAVHCFVPSLTFGRCHLFCPIPHFPPLQHCPALHLLVVYKLYHLGCFVFDPINIILIVIVWAMRVGDEPHHLSLRCPHFLLPLKCHCPYFAAI